MSIYVKHCVFFCLRHLCFVFPQKKGFQKSVAPDTIHFNMASVRMSVVGEWVIDSGRNLISVTGQSSSGRSCVTRHGVVAGVNGSYKGLGDHPDLVFR
jgi:hypothetical protein